MTLFDEPEAPPPESPTPPAPLPRLPAARRDLAVAWLRKRLAVIRAFRFEDCGGRVGVEDAARLVAGRRDLAGFDPEYIAEAFRGPV